MDRSSEKSRKSLTRRSVLKLPLFCWLTSLLKGNAFAKALAAEPMSVGGILAPRTTCLNGAWSLTYGPLTEYPEKSPGTKPPADWPTIPATVPGNVELDMVAAGKIEPLEKGNRVLQALKLENHQWWYKCTFKAGHGEPDEISRSFRGSGTSLYAGRQVTCSSIGTDCPPQSNTFVRYQEEAAHGRDSI